MNTGGSVLGCSVPGAVSKQIIKKLDFSNPHFARLGSEDILDTLRFLVFSHL
jgi:hypothetical protein